MRDAVRPEMDVSIEETFVGNASSSSATNFSSNFNSSVTPVVFASPSSIVTPPAAPDSSVTSIVEATAPFSQGSVTPLTFDSSALQRGQTVYSVPSCGIVIPTAASNSEQAHHGEVTQQPSSMAIAMRSLVLPNIGPSILSRVSTCASAPPPAPAALSISVAAESPVFNSPVVSVSGNPQNNAASIVPTTAQSKDKAINDAKAIILEFTKYKNEFSARSYLYRTDKQRLSVAQSVIDAGNTYRDARLQGKEGGAEGDAFVEALEAAKTHAENNRGWKIRPSQLLRNATEGLQKLGYGPTDGNSSGVRPTSLKKNSQ
jgi:hypothetical protein